MPQCKTGHCKEQAVPYGKQYCLLHLAQYKARQDKEREKQANRVRCTSCRESLPHLRKLDGFETCKKCEEVKSQEDAALSLETTKQYALDECTTVEHLKSWMREYI